MLLVSRKLIFIENETVLLCLTMQERARVFAAKILWISLWHSFCDYKVQCLWWTFQTHFGMGKMHFQKVVLRMKLFLSLLSFICHIANIVVWKYVFTRVVVKIKICHSRRTRVVRVALVPYSCRLCLTRIALVLLVLHLCRIRVACVWHLCCKID